MANLEERSRLSQALNEIDLRIHSNQSPDETMQAALDGFVTALCADAGHIELRDNETWVVRYQRGFHPEEVGLVLAAQDAPVAERVSRERGPVTIEDFLSEPEEFYVGFPRKHHLRATLAVPLVARDEIIGCLFAWMRDEPRAFSPGEIDFGRRMAASLALALQNARLLESEHAARERAESAEAQLAEELERTRLLLRAVDELTTARDSNELMARLADIVLDATGISRIFVNLIDLDRQLLTPKIPATGLSAPGGVRIPFDRLSNTACRAIEEGATAILDYDLPDLAERDRAISQANGARLVLFVPLIYSGTLIGHISLDEPGERAEFSPEQIRLVESIASQAAVMLQNLRLYEREHRIAETLQQAILETPRAVEGLELGFVYQPAYAAANVGGDFYDMFEIDGRRVALVIGDISGKGAEAAKLTALIRDATRAYVLEEHDPAAALSKVNALTHRFTTSEKFATVFLGVLDIVDGTLRYCSVGHPAPVVVHAGEAAPLLTTPGLVGAFDYEPYRTLEATLEIGDRLVLVTDGITEARAASGMLGEDGVVEILRRLGEASASDTPRLLLAEALSFSPVLRDDAAILCVERTPRP